MPNPRLKTLYEKASALPLCPGVYLMKDLHDTIIYVGKSRKLKNRVSSYFSGEDHNLKTEKMISHVHDFDYILCDGEMEALTLENTLIKKYTPHYNIRLKDAKTYPYIKITNEEYPKILVSRERKNDKGKYFGPYASASSAREVVDALSIIFHLPTCRRVFPRDIGKDRPCLYKQMGRCCAPCTNSITKEDYLNLISGAALVLSGDISKTKKHLEEKMFSAADSEQYELAARFRDSISSLEKLSDKQKVVGNQGENRDVFALYQDDLCGVIAILSIRDGKLQRKNEFVFSAAAIEEAEDTTAWLLSHYENLEEIPPEILIRMELQQEDYDLLSEFFTQKTGHKVEVRTPKKGTLKKLSDMAYTNAKERADRYKRETEREDTTLVTLANLLKLEVLPERIESYDISEIGSEHITASMVVTNGTKLKPSDYRTFKMKTLHGVDDYEAMRETLRRRFAHIGDGTPSLGTAPDLILLDGGIGQVHAVQQVMREMNIQIPVFGMVKDDFHKTRALTDGEQELSIALEQSVFIFLYKLQEEVHRVAVRATMHAKTKTLKHSILEKIEGIGPKKAKNLLMKMNIRDLKSATIDEMVKNEIPKADATKVYEYYHREEKKQ